MLRTGASRMAARSVAMPASCSAKTIFHRATLPTQWATKFSSMTTKRPQLVPVAQLRPVQAAILRRTMADKIDREAEKKYAQEKIEPTPELVSATSSVRTTFGEVGAPDKGPPGPLNVASGMKGDIETIKDTFDLSSVPRPAYYMGLAGVLPYLGTSLSTVMCAYEINHAEAGSGYFMSAKTAENLLHILEPVQIGYGAVILSFLGAIHWGLEFGKFGGNKGYPRYAIGVMAPAVAWPTMLMSVESALISQFAAFTILYYVDSRATTRGWTPSWYGIYRFVLTFIVGASIVVSLIGRGEVAHRVSRMPGAVDRVTASRESAQDSLVEEEEKSRAQQAAQSSKDGETGKKSRAV